MSESKTSPSLETLSPPSFELTQKERSLFDLLLSVQLQHFPDAQMRVAGGWVRDKILGKESHDIDIALPVRGVLFAEKVNETLVGLKEEVHAIGTIKANPEMSKHLETATVKIFDLWVDFVNLRTDIDHHLMNGNDVVVATPREDAALRDLTLNALFYNINTHLVEDYVGGIADINARLLRTPLSPLKTLSDDPNRLMRTFRFASKYEYTISDDILSAARSPELQSRLATGVSRERIGSELAKLLESDHPVIGLEGIVHTGLLPAVLGLVESELFMLPNIALSFKKMNFLLQLLPLEQDAQAKLLLLSLLLPLHLHTPPLFRLVKGNKTDLLTSWILHEGLVFSHGVKQEYEQILNGVGCMSRVHREVERGTATRLQLGLAIREAGATWLLSSTLALLATFEISENGVDLEPAVSIWHRVNSLVASLALEKAYELRPMLNGNELMQLLNIKPGLIIRTLLEEQITFQLSHPMAELDAVKAHIIEVYRNRS